MILLSHLLNGIGNILHFGVVLFYFLLIAHVVCSWVRADPSNMLVQIIYGTTEPLLARIRRKVPPLGMLDTSVLVAFALLMFVDLVIVASMLDYARVLGSGVPRSNGIIGM